MSEKRFIIFPNNVVWDNQLDEVVCRCILEGIGDAENVCQRLNKQQATIKSKDKQLERLYNYFQDYLKDEMSGNAFSEMWDNVKEDERWNDE